MMKPWCLSYRNPSFRLQASKAYYKLHRYLVAISRGRLGKVFIYLHFSPIRRHEKNRSIVSSYSFIWNLHNGPKNGGKSAIKKKLLFKREYFDVKKITSKGCFMIKKNSDIVAFILWFPKVSFFFQIFAHCVSCWLFPKFKFY